MYEKFVVIDVETTGLHLEKDKIVEISITFRKEGELVSRSGFVNPEGVAIPPEASAVHHITGEMVKDAPNIGEVLKNLAIPEDVLLVAHNAEFDRGFLPYLKDYKWVDTLRLAKHLYPDSPGFGNQVLRYYLELCPVLPLDLAPHRAEYDTIVTHALIDRMLQGHTLQELYHLQSKPILLKVARFGKHKGTPWRDVPKDYLQWMLKQTGDNSFDEDTRHTCRYWLEH